MSKTPWLKFYPSDWQADHLLGTCSLAARGLWVEMLCVMHAAEPPASLARNSVALTVPQIAVLARCSVKEAQRCLDELEAAGVFSRDVDGTIFSRRMRRDIDKAERDRANGKAGGGNPTLRRGTVPKEQRVRPFKRTDAPVKTQRIFAKTGGHCHWCSVELIFNGTDTHPRNFHVDHVIPICDGGTNDESNLVPACAACNHDRSRIDYPTRTRSLNPDYNPDSKAQIPEARYQKEPSREESSLGGGYTSTVQDKALGEVSPSSAARDTFGDYPRLVHGGGAR